MSVVRVISSPVVPCEAPAPLDAAKALCAPTYGRCDLRFFLLISGDPLFQRYQRSISAYLRALF